MEITRSEASAIFDPNHGTWSSKFIFFKSWSQKRSETQSDNYLQFLSFKLHDPGLHRLQSLITRLKPKLHLLQSLVPIKGLVAQTILDPELYEPRLRFIFYTLLDQGSNFEWVRTFYHKKVSYSGIPKVKLLVIYLSMGIQNIKE